MKSPLPCDSHKPEPWTALHHGTQRRPQTAEKNLIRKPPADKTAGGFCFDQICIIAPAGAEYPARSHPDDDT